MKNLEALNKIETLEAVDVHVVPIRKDIATQMGYVNPNHGSKGEAFEMLVNLFLNGQIRSKYGIAGKGKFDTKYHGHKIEVKSGSGTLENVLKSEFVVYSPDSEIETALVFSARVFLEIVNACGLVRQKKMSDGSIKTTIQSFKNSNKKNALFRGMLAKYGMTLEEFKITH